MYTNINVHRSLGVDWESLIGIDSNTKEARIGVDKFILIPGNRERERKLKLIYLLNQYIGTIPDN